MPEMKTPQECMRDIFQRNIDDLTKRRDSDWSWLPDLPAMLGVNLPDQWSLSVGQDPYLYLPFDRKLIETVRTKMLELGFTLTWETKEAEIDNSYSDYRQSWQLGEWAEHKSIVIAFDDTKPGSVCKRHKIGKVMVEKTIYEFSCVSAEA